ncbi:MAG: ATP-binding protein [Pseudomonadota bacterium]
MKQYLLSSSKKFIHSKPAFFEQANNIIPKNHQSEAEASLESQFGFFEWNIKEDKIKICPYLSQILAFKTTNSRQSYTAWKSITHPDDALQLKLALDEINLKKTSYIITESRKLCRDGKWRWFAVRGKFIDFDSEGDPVRSVGTCTDITELKEAGLTLQQMKHLFSEIKRIKECHQSGLSIYKLCSEILNSFERLTNSTKSMLIFSSTSNLNLMKHTLIKSNDPSLYNFSSEEASTLISNPEKLEFIHKMLNIRTNYIQNGDKISLLGIHLNFPFQQQGIIIIERAESFDEALLDFLEPLIGTVNNIISIKKMQENSSELDNILSFFIQQVPAPVAMFDTNMCYKFASNAWRKEFRFSETSPNIIGKSHYEINPRQPKEWREHHQRALKGETLMFDAVEIVDYLDEPFWAEGSVHPWYTLSEDIGGVIIYSNIATERKQIEKNLDITVENLTRSNQSLELFAHICSHDLKEPLRSISNFTQLLFNINSDQFNEESLLYVRYIVKGIERMNSLIKDILVYSKAASKTQPERLSLDLNDIINEIKETLDYSIKEVDACFKVAYLPAIFGSPTQIKQLFLNLISNSLKFHSDKPLIIELFAVEKTSFWEIHIRDNGIGIDEEYREDIFTIFKRLHSKNQYEGSGIGLSTCQKIVHEHLGEIHVKSIPEGGSEFIFTLPK